MEEQIKKVKKRDYFWLVCKYTLLATVLALFIRGFLLIPMPIEGNSMESTLKQGDMVAVDRVSSINRFDIVVFKQPDGTMYVKRVIGLPGDKIKYTNDQLLINDQEVAEPFIRQNQRKDKEKNSYTNDFDLEELLGVERLGKESYFVIGDNRRMSKDSRSFGAIAGDTIIGKVRFVYYPFPRWQFF